MGGGNLKVAAASGVPLGSLNNYLAGREMKASTAFRIARACGVSLEWLVTGADSGTGPVPDAAQFDEYLVVPRYDDELAAGSGSVATDQAPVEAIGVGRSLLPQSVWAARDRLVALTVRGDSMEPTLSNGDLVFVDRARERLVSGAIYVIRAGEQLLVKRLEQRIDGDLVVTSDNKRYSEQVVSAEQARQLWNGGNAPATIVGRIVWRSGATA
ncbi:putative phage repressor [Gluconacetobacter diazotrophicus PA1 5]|uniref:XRE family transcriptional regulator n=1 Tax=Gluconacetobacter diazotrophicus TaxID=33996 RepID=UPI000173CF12|nr:LexA family transcriptional regulator [Gluconacetobacter diazotrophicus]ACI51289.1 putative phage repressor [Gluconacetobacter diazotrophicus PA1 5]TWB09837.1 phage repressor protein C with HTH and peptisase S24 domain [Gluconacetobacter diazotrophicus]